MCWNGGEGHLNSIFFMILLVTSNFMVTKAYRAVGKLYRAFFDVEPYLFREGRSGLRKINFGIRECRMD